MTNKDESVRKKTLNQQLKKQTSNKILMIQLNKLEESKGHLQDEAIEKRLTRMLLKK